MTRQLAGPVLLLPIVGVIQKTVDRRSHGYADDLDAARHELVDAVQQTVQPVHASVWLRR